MSNPGSRTLQLLSLLQSRRFWAGVELADRLEVSARTLRRDVERLRQLGYPVEAQRGVEGGYQLAAGAVLPPLVLDDDEAVAIGVGLQSAIQGGSVAGIEQSSVRALTKVVHVMPSRLRRRIDALSAVTVPAPWEHAPTAVDADVLVSLAQACRDGERVGFAYRDRGGERTFRVVDPHRLVLMGRRWYLVAWDLDRADWRTFRLDRLTEPGTTGAQVMPREIPDGDAGKFVRTGIDNLPSRYQVEVRIHASVSEVRERIGPWGALEESGEAHCLLRMTSDTLDWPTLVLANAGAEFEVLAPAALVDLLRSFAGRVGRAVGGATDPSEG